MDESQLRRIWTRPHSLRLNQFLSAALGSEETAGREPLIETLHRILPDYIEELSRLEARTLTVRVSGPGAGGPSGAPDMTDLIEAFACQDPEDQPGLHAFLSGPLADRLEAWQSQNPNDPVTPLQAMLPLLHQLPPQERRHAGKHLGLLVAPLLNAPLRRRDDRGDRTMLGLVWMALSDNEDQDNLHLVPFLHHLLVRAAEATMTPRSVGLAALALSDILSRTNFQATGRLSRALVVLSGLCLHLAHRGGEEQSGLQLDRLGLELGHLKPALGDILVGLQDSCFLAGLDENQQVVIRAVRLVAGLGGDLSILHLADQLFPDPRYGLMVHGLLIRARLKEMTLPVWAERDGLKALADFQDRLMHGDALQDEPLLENLRSLRHHFDPQFTATITTKLDLNKMGQDLAASLDRWLDGLAAWLVPGEGWDRTAGGIIRDLLAHQLGEMSWSLALSEIQSLLTEMDGWAEQGLSRAVRGLYGDALDQGPLVITGLVLADDWRSMILPAGSAKSAAHSLRTIFGAQGNP